jgi:hypothetical protein
MCLNSGTLSQVDVRRTIQRLCKPVILHGIDECTPHCTSTVKMRVVFSTLATLLILINTSCLTAAKFVDTDHSQVVVNEANVNVSPPGYTEVALSSSHKNLGPPEFPDSIVNIYQKPYCAYTVRTFSPLCAQSCTGMLTIVSLPLKCPYPHASHRH